jgi:hypothetical protein
VLSIPDDLRLWICTFGLVVYTGRDDWDGSDDGAQDSDALVTSFQLFLDQLAEQW